MSSSAPSSTSGTDYRELAREQLSRVQVNPKNEETEPSADDQASVPQKESQATQLVNLARKSGIELFDSDEDSYATVSVNGHSETYSVRSRSMRSWLVHGFLRTHEKAPNSDALRSALETLSAIGRFESSERSVSARIGAVADRLYLDLCNPVWQIIEIDRTGWRLVESKDCPIRFRRAHGMRELPVPRPGASLAELRPFLNTESNDDYNLEIAWLLGCFRATGPYPIMILHGEQGSAKSTTARVLRDLIDPNAAPIRSEPEGPRDLMISAKNAWLCVFDNLSHLPSWLSDALCRLSTGGGFSTRELYSDAEEIIFDAQRPVILTGIEELATRGDLLSRSIIQYLPQIPENRRLPETEFYGQFNELRPGILGALLDAVSCALRNEGSVRLDSLPRLADFAKWVTAVESKLGWTRGTFPLAYSENRRGANDITLESSPVVPAIQKLGDFTGTATELLETLESSLSDRARNSRAWPKSGRRLSNVLRRLAPNLRSIGISIEFSREATRRLIVVSKAESTGETSSSSSSSSNHPEQGLFSDDGSPRDDATIDAASQRYVHRQPKSPMISV